MLFSKKKKALIDAVLSERHDSTLTMLGLGVNPNFRYKGYTPLWYACASGWGNLGIVESLLNAGADPNIRGANGLVPLHIAAQEGDFRAVFQLLKAGAD